jgi:hypothetical protein
VGVGRKRLIKENESWALAGGGKYKFYKPSPGLRHAIAASLEDAKRALVSHAHQTSQCKLQHHAALERHKVAHILQHEEARPVVVTVTQVRRNQGILQRTNSTYRGGCNKGILYGNAIGRG